MLGVEGEEVPDVELHDLDRLARSDVGQGVQRGQPVFSVAGRVGNRGGDGGVGGAGCREDDGYLVAVLVDDVVDDPAQVAVHDGVGGVSRVAGGGRRAEAGVVVLVVVVAEAYFGAAHGVAGRVGDGDARPHGHPVAEEPQLVAGVECAVAGRQRFEGARRDLVAGAVGGRGEVAVRGAVRKVVVVRRLGVGREVDRLEARVERVVVAVPVGARRLLELWLLTRFEVLDVPGGAAHRDVAIRERRGCRGCGDDERRHQGEAEGREGESSAHDGSEKRRRGGGV